VFLVERLSETWATLGLPRTVFMVAARFGGRLGGHGAGG
jgi:hypothetical protein